MHRTRASLAMLFILLAAMAAPVGNRDAGAADSDAASMGVLWQNATGHNATLWSVRWSPDGSMLSATYFDNTTVVFNASTGKRIVVLGSHPLPRGRCDGEKKCTIAEHTPMRVSAWSPDGRYLAMGGDDRVVLLYNTSDWALARLFVGHRGSVLALDFSPDGRYLASGSGTDKVEMNNANDENVIKIWDVQNSSLVRDLVGHQDGVLEVKWSPDGSRLASVSDDKLIKIWRSSNWTLEAELRGHTLGVLCADFSPDGKMLVTGSRDYTIRLWDLVNLTPVARWSVPNCVRSVDWHPDGKWIAASGVDETMLTVRNATTGVVLKTFMESGETRSAVMSARWSPDGSRLAAGAGKEATLRIYSFGRSREAPAEAIPWWVPRLAAYSILSWAGVGVFIVLAMRHMDGERR